ncbi:hypothetical protein ACGVWS_00575 [Enterobacteriaceae bacterium LUAb1]
MNVDAIALYSSLFGHPVPEVNDIIDEHFDFGHLLTLSMLSWQQYDVRFAQWITKNISDAWSDGTVAENVIFNKHPSSLLLWIKYLSKSIKPLDITQFNIYNYMQDTIKLLSIINESEVKNNQIYSINHELNDENDNLNYRFHRTCEIIINSRTLKNYKECFRSRYAVEISAYISICYTIISLYSQYKNMIYPGSWVLEVNDFSRHTGYPVRLVKKVMNMISFIPEDIYKYEDKDIFKSYDFAFFKNNPFLKIDETKYIPVDGRCVQELLFENVIYKILSSSGNEALLRCDIFSACKDYLNSLAISACDHSAMFTCIEEQEEGEEKSNYFCIYGHDRQLNQEIVMVFDIQPETILYHAHGMDESSEKTMPVTNRDRLSKKTKEIYKTICAGIYPEITKDKKYYFMSVSMDNLSGGQSLSKEKENYHYDINTGGECNLSVGEFEMMMELISGDTDFSVSDFFEKKCRNDSVFSCREYVKKIKQDKPCKNSEFEKMLQRSQNIILDLTRQSAPLVWQPLIKAQAILPMEWN